MRSKATPAMIDARAREVAAEWLNATVGPLGRWRVTHLQREYRLATEEATQEALAALVVLDAAAAEWCDKHKGDSRHRGAENRLAAEEAEAALHKVIGAVRHGINRCVQQPNARPLLRQLPPPPPPALAEIRHVVVMP